MRIVSWNMDSWKRPAKTRAEAWDFLIHELDPDIALVQEAKIPKRMTRAIEAKGAPDQRSRARNFLEAADLGLGHPVPRRKPVTRWS